MTNSLQSWFVNQVFELLCQSPCLLGKQELLNRLSKKPVPQWEGEPVERVFQDRVLSIVLTGLLDSSYVCLVTGDDGQEVVALTAEGFVAYKSKHLEDQVAVTAKTPEPSTMTSSMIPLSALEVTDSLLYERLKNLRQTLCQQYSVKPHWVCSNRILQALATSKPTSLEEVQMIKGVGATFSQRYAPAFIDCIVETVLTGQAI